MTKAVIDKQIIITVNNEVGALSEVTGILAEASINLFAICAYDVENKGVIMFVEQDNKTAAQLLRAKNYDVREEEIILLTLDNKPGALQAVAGRIADAGIDMTLLYGSADKKSKTTRVVIISEDNQAALMAIKG